MLRIWPALALVATGLLGGCESGRLGGRGQVVAATRPSAPIELPEPTVSTVPSGSVTAEPLAPPPGSAPPGGSFAPGPSADVPVMPGSPRSIETLGSSGNPDAPRGASSRSAAVGGWTAREATGSSCRVNLSSTPSLDLYRASASGCANKDLARITAWDFKEGEIYLFQPGGAVAARLRGNGGDLSGVLSKSGAPLTLSRS